MGSHFATPAGNCAAVPVLVTLFSLALGFRLNPLSKFLLLTQGQMQVSPGLGSSRRGPQMHR